MHCLLGIICIEAKKQMEDNFFDLLTKINQMCATESEKIKNFYDGVDTNFQSELFELKDNKSKLNCLQVSGTEVGIYIFIVESNFCIDARSFDSVKYAAQTNDYLSIDGCLKRGDCFYLGKSESDILGRINEHINNKTTKTYSLRLNYEERIYTKEHLRLYSFVLKDHFKKYKKLLLSVVESYLHESLHPKVGSKRA